jgi:hypothetical protein
VGLTDRLSLSFPMPGVGLGLGRQHRYEVLLFGGFYEGGLMIPWPGESSDYGVYGVLGAGFDQRRSLSDSVSILTSSWMGAPASLASSGRDTGQAGMGSGLGVEVHLGSHVTLRPSAGGDLLFEGPGRIVYTVGGSLRRGVRELPLIEIWLGDNSALVADFALSFDPERPGAPIQETWIGFASAGARKKEK